MGRFLLKYDQCPYKKGKFGHMCTNRQYHMKRKAEIGVILEAKEMPNIASKPAETRGGAIFIQKEPTLLTH